MSFVEKIKRKFLFNKKKSEKGKGLIILNEVSEAMQVENMLRAFGYEVRGVAPPPEIRKGCDLAVEFNLVDQLGIERLLRRSGLVPVDIVSLDNISQKPLEITKEKDFGDYLMVTAGNMKITIDKNTKIIVNISGGGCPDVPYLALSLLGKKLDEIEIDEIGFSLCAYMLKKAYKRALNILNKN